jgi:hypothetical protein
MLVMPQGSGPGALQASGNRDARPMLSNLPVRLVAIIGALLLAAGAVALWVASGNGRAGATTTRPAAKAPAENPADVLADPADALLAPPVAPPRKSKEEQRFVRADRDDDGRITQAEYLQQRRRNFDKLDANGDGRLSFEEYATSGIGKFRKADANADGALLPSEYATTAPKPKNRQMASVEPCRCPPPRLAGSSDE